jgi:hypothetical protein
MRHPGSRLRQFSVSDAEFEAYLSRQRRDPQTLPVDRTIERIRVEGHQRVAPRQIVARIRIAPGEELDPTLHRQPGPTALGVLPGGATDP